MRSITAMLILFLCPLLVNAQREGAFRVPISNSTAISNDPNTQSRTNLMVTIPSGEKFQFYQIIGRKIIPNIDNKQYYVDFDKSQEVLRGKTFTFNGAYLSREIITQLTNKFNSKNDNELVKKMNGATEDDWKAVLFGVDSEEITRLAGIAELKRRYQDFDEHFGLMLNENYGGKAFEKAYFIPTGFVEVKLDNGKIAFLKASDLIQKKIKIDVDRLKVSILKNTLLYFIEDLGENNQVESSVLNTVFDLASCSQICILKQNNLGDLIKEVIDIQNNSERSNNKALALIAFYKAVCSSDKKIDTILADYRDNKAKNISNEDINNYFKLVLQYPDLSVEYYRDAYLKLKDSRLVPYAVINRDKKINDGFKKSALEALNSGLTPEGLNRYFSVAKAFGEKNELTPSYYAHLISFLESDYIEWVIGPYYKEIQQKFPGDEITVEEFIHLINFANGQKTLIKLLSGDDRGDILSLRKNRASNFWVFPNRVYQNSQAADAKRK